MIVPSMDNGHDLVAWILRRKIAVGQLLLSYQSAVDRKYHLCTQVNFVDGKIICIVVTDCYVWLFCRFLIWHIIPHLWQHGCFTALCEIVNLFRSCMDAAAFTLQNWHHSLGSKLFLYRASAMEMFTTWLHSYSSFPTPVVWAAGNLCRPTLRNLVYNAYEINYESTAGKLHHVDFRIPSKVHELITDMQ